MKTLSLIPILGLLLNLPHNARAADDLATALQRGLFEEEANRDPAAAIQAYQAVLAEHDQQRKLAATAVFRLGECYRKLGRTNDAILQYQRILRDFSDQDPLAHLSRQQLAGLGAAPDALVPAGQLTAPPDEETGTIQSLQKMLKESPDLINAARPLRGTPLQEAVRKGQLRVAQFLLENKADVNVPLQPSGYTSLHLAVDAGSKSMVELLLEQGADVEAQDNSKNTPLHVAAMRGFNTITEVLLAHGANVNAVTAEDQTPLHFAAEKGYRSVVETLLDHGAKLDATTRDGLTPLLLAVAKGQLAIAELLLEHGASLQSADSEGRTALHSLFRANANRLQLMELLLGKGADVNAQAKNGDTPLHYAAMGNPEDLLRLLLSRKPELESRNQQGMTPLMNVALQSDSGIGLCRLLLEAGASPNVNLTQGFSLLHYEVATRRLDMVELLLVHHANPNVTNPSGETPLSTAKKMASSNDPKMTAVGLEIAQLLLQYGADEDLQRRGLIMVRRGDWAQPVFYRGTNTDNNYTLFELLTTIYADTEMNRQLPFPDFSKIRIHSLPDPLAKERSAPPENPLAGLQLDTGDCTLNGPLDWGDVVEIPEADHKINEKWISLPFAVANTLKQCLERHVRIVLGGETTEITLEKAPPAAGPVGVAVRPIPPRSFSASGSPTSVRTNLNSFRLKAVLTGSNLLRTSSDLSRVKVTRIDPVTAQPVEMLFDLSESASYDERTDLWLREGDVIEVP